MSQRSHSLSCKHKYLRYNPHRLKYLYGRSNLIVVNPLNFVVNNFLTSRSFYGYDIHVCFFIEPFTFDRLHAFRWVYQVPSLISYMDTISDNMASSHLTKSGPIITSLYVISSSLSNNNTSS